MDKKNFVVVLGLEHSGADLLMQVVKECGLSISIAPVNGDTISRKSEGTDIGRVYDEEILSTIGASRTLPVSFDHFPMGLKNDAIRKLRKIVEEKKTAWGFHDPFTACLLPLWWEVCNQIDTTPIFLLAVRNPAHWIGVAKGPSKGADLLAELTWLTCYADALHYTGGNCFLLHYEDWFARPNEMIHELLKYAGLDQISSEQLNAIFAIANLKTSIMSDKTEPYNLRNEQVVKLYGVLKECRGCIFDSTRLLSVVAECRRAMNAFKGWYLEAQRVRMQRENEIPDNAKSDLKNLVKQNNHYLSIIKEMHDEVENLRINERWLLQKFKIAFDPGRIEMQKLAAWIRELEKKFLEFETSLRWKIGDFIVNTAELVLLRPKKSLTTDTLKRVFQELENQPLNYSEQDVFIQRFKWIRKDFKALFVSRRWRIGDQIVSIMERSVFKATKPLIADQVNEIFTQFEDWENNRLRFNDY